MVEHTSQFRIDQDLLGLVSFLIRGGNGSCQYGADIWWLTEVADLEPHRVVPHIITLAFENIPGWAGEVYTKYAVGQLSLTKESERFFRNRGFLYGATPKVPKLVLKECRWRMKYLYKVNV